MILRRGTQVREIAWSRASLDLDSDSVTDQCFQLKVLVDKFIFYNF